MEIPALSLKDVYERRKEIIRPGEGRFVDFHNKHVVFCMLATVDMKDFFDSLMDYASGVCIAMVLGNGRFLNLCFLGMNVLIIDYQNATDNCPFSIFFASLLMDVRIIPATEYTFQWLMSFSYGRPGNARIGDVDFVKSRSRYMSLHHHLYGRDEYTARVLRERIKIEDNGVCDLWTLVCTAATPVFIHLIEARIIGYTEYVLSLENTKSETKREFKDTEFVVFKTSERGSYEIVQAAMHLETHYLYAIKKNEETHRASNIQREYSIMSTLPRYWSLVHAFGYIRYDATTYGIVMEYGVYGSLWKLKTELIPGNKVFCESGCLDQSTMCITMIADISAAIAYLNKFGFVHRDIKPTNIVIGYGLRAMLCDFGSCVRWQDGCQQLKGNATVEWMPIETTVGNEYTFSTESYSLELVKEYIEEGMKLRYPKVSVARYPKTETREDNFLPRFDRVKYLRRTPISLLCYAAYMMVNSGYVSGLCRCVMYLTDYYTICRNQDLDYYNKEMNALLGQIDEIATGKCHDTRKVYREVAQKIIDVRDFWDIALRDPNLYYIIMKRLLTALVNIRKLALEGDWVLVTAVMGNNTFSHIDTDDPKWDAWKSDEADLSEFCLAYYLIHFERNIKTYSCQGHTELTELYKSIRADIPDKFFVTGSRAAQYVGMSVKIRFEFGKYLYNLKDKTLVAEGEKIIKECIDGGFVQARRYYIKQYLKQGCYDEWFEKISEIAHCDGDALRSIFIARYRNPMVPESIKRRIDAWKMQHMDDIDDCELFDTMYGLKERAYALGQLSIDKLVAGAIELPSTLMDVLCVTSRYDEKLAFRYVADYAELLAELWIILSMNGMNKNIWKVLSNWNMDVTIRAELKALYKEMDRMGFIKHHVKK